MLVTRDDLPISHGIHGGKVGDDNFVGILDAIARSLEPLPLLMSSGHCVEKWMPATQIGDARVHLTGACVASA